jgi:hypothetical protein
MQFENLSGCAGERSPASDLTQSGASFVILWLCYNNIIPSGFRARFRLKYHFEILPWRQHDESCNIRIPIPKGCSDMAQSGARDL